MEEQLKQLAALFSKLPPEDQKRASELLKGVTPSNAPAPGGEKVNLPATTESSGTKTNISASPQSDAIKAGLTNPKIDAIELRAFADMEAARRSKSANRPMIQSSTRPNDPNDNKFRKEVYRELGISDPLSENRSAFDLNRLDAKAAAIGKSREEYESMPRLERMKLESAGAAAEQARRQGIRDSVALPISDNAAWADGFKQQGLPTPGNKRDIFKDKDGRLEDPATLKARLIKEGMNPNDATIAAGQRYRDMFAPPNAKKDGFGMQGGQASAVMNADPERRMDVMQQLKDARKDNLQALAEARRNNPFRKEVGITTKIEAPDGTVLAQRGEGEVRTDRAGNTVDAPGRMNFLNGASNLKDALTTYNNADVAKRPNVPLYYEGTNEPVSVGGEQRFTTAPAPTKSLVTVNPDTNTLTPVAGDSNISSKKGVELSGQRIGTKVTGAYGTAVGGISGGTPLTQEQRLGAAPLPPETQKARDALVGGPTLPQGMEMKDGKLRAYEKDPVKEQLAKNQRDALDKAADEELKRRQQRKGVA